MYNAPFDTEPSLAEQTHGLGQDLPLRLFHDPALKQLRRVPLLNGNGTLEDDGAAIAVGADKVDGGAGDLDPVGQGRLVDVEPVKALAAEGGDQGRVDIDVALG